MGLVMKRFSFTNGSMTFFVSAGNLLAAPFVQKNWESSAPPKMFL